MINCRRLVRISARIGFPVLLCLSFYLSVSMPDEQSLIASLWDKFSHAAGYFTLVLMLDFAYRPALHIGAKSSAILAYSIGIECIQFFIPYREFSLLDILANATGIGIFLILRILAKYTIPSFPE